LKGTLTRRIRDREPGRRQPTEVEDGAEEQDEDGQDERELDQALAARTSFPSETRSVAYQKAHGDPGVRVSTMPGWSRPHLSA